ncbi:MAG: Hpt domain-containing protein [Treponema sp.]|nr:Hpt domain-containing protein [Treponema sp.]
MITIEALKEAGANVQEGLERCLGKEDFYLKQVNMGLTNQNFELLEASLKEKDLDRAFEICHSLKGVIGNLSLTPLYELICSLTEKLRSKSDEDYSALYDQIMAVRQKFLSL